MLEVRDVSKSFGDKKVLEKISIKADRGEAVSVLGKNGGGKTTLFKIILGLLEADEGTVTFDGKPLRLKDIGYLPEERSLYYDCPVEKQLRHFGLLKGVRKEELNGIIDYWLHRTGTWQYRDTIPLKLSKGNQQKIQMIVALLNDPEIIVLDEPWTGLDVNNIELFQKLISEQKYKNKLILLSSHQHQQVQRICDRYIYLNNGKTAVNITRKDLENSEYRSLSVTYKNGYYLQDDDILKEIYLDNKCTYIVRNETAAKRLAQTVSNYPEVTGIELRRLNINDLIEGKDYEGTN